MTIGQYLTVLERNWWKWWAGPAVVWKIGARHCGTYVCDVSKQWYHPL